MKYIFSTLFIFTFSFLICNFSFAQNAQRGVLKGRVSDEKGNLLAGASIFIHDIRVLVIADSIGLYQSPPVGQGNYLVEITYQGFAASIQHVAIKGETIKDFVLLSTAVEQEAVTVTGVSSATRLKLSPQAVSLVKKSELMQSSAPNLMASLARKGGVTIVSTGPAIAKPIIRGLGSNRVVTINDGIRQEGQQWGDEHGIEIDEQSVKKVEILKGPSSLMYGSDAMAGVINILSNQPITSGTIKGNIYNSYTDNNSMISSYADLSGHLLNGLNWNLYGAIKSAKDYQNKYDGSVLNSRFKEENLGGYVGINKAWGFSHLIITSFNQKLGIPEGVRDSASGKFLIFPETQYEAIANDDQLNSRNFITPYQQVNHFKIALDNSFSIGLHRLAATIGYQRNQRREFADPDAPKVPELYFDLNTINYNFQFHFAQKNGWKSTLGINGMQQQNRNKADEKLIPEYNLFDAGIFAVTAKTFKQLTVSGGLRLDMRNLEIKGFKENGESKFTAFTKNYRNFSGSVGLAYEATNTITLKANIAKGYRAPNAAELSSNGAHEGTYRYENGDKNLNVENSYQIDAGLEIATNHVSFGISTFYNHIDNFIFYRRLASVNGGDSILLDNGTELQAFKFSQAQASLAGFEATLDIHPHPLDWLHIENTFSFVSGSFSNAIEGSKNLPAIPPERLLTEVRGNFSKVGAIVKNFYAKVEVEATFKQNRIFSAYNTETPTPGYSLLNFGTGADIGSKNKTLISLYFSVNNITDVAFQSHLSRLKYTDLNNATNRQGIFNMGRNFTIKLNIPINFK